MIYDTWPRVLYGKFIELNEIAKELNKNGNEETKRKFQKFFKKFLNRYDCLDMEQQGQFHELVCYVLSEQAIYVKF